MQGHVDLIASPRSRRTHATMLQAFALTALGLTSACGDNIGADDSPDAMPAAQGPLYAIATTQFLPDSTTTLIALVEDPGAPVMLDASRALEVGGAAAIFGTSGQGVLAVGSSESPVLTRYEITPDGGLVEGDRLSFANTGVSSAFKRQGLVPFLSETKAYWLDDLTQQVVVWNPDAMTIDGSFSLEAAAREELVFELGERAVVRDDGLLFVGARYRTANEGEAGRAVALIIDTAADELVEVLEDPRCGDTVHVVADQSGTLYFGSGSVAAVLYALQRPAGYPAPCMLRILPGERRFDPDFQINIPDLVEGRSAGRLVAGKDGHAYVLALHEDYLDVELGEATEIWEPWDATAWRWWRFQLGSDTSAKSVDSAPLASAAGGVLHAGGQDYITHVRIEDGATTLLVADEDGSLTAGLEAPGFPYGLLQVR